MLQAYLINILLFCAVLLLIVFIVGTVQLVIILIDVRKTTREVTEKVRAITSLLDIVSILFGALNMTKGKIKDKIPGKSTLFALVSGLKKGLETLLRK
jgi:CHASE3 domain sensor protein